MYKAGEMDLAAVAVATNTAFELPRSMEEEIDPLLKKHKGGAELLGQCFLTVCNDMLGLNPFDKLTPFDDYNYQCYPMSCDFMYGALCLLQGFLQGNPGDSVPNYNGKFGWFDADLVERSNAQRWQQDKAAMLEMMSDLVIMGEVLGATPVQDELIRGMKLMRKTRAVPVWCAFACQVFLDILRLTRDDYDRAWKELDETNLLIRAYIRASPESSPERKKLWALAFMWDDDPLYHIKDAHMMETGNAHRNERWSFLRLNPLFCGLWIHHMRTSFHYEGVNYAAVPGAVMCTAQLYHALKQEALLAEEPKREDLDEFMTMQGRKTFFMGNPPTDFEGYFKNFCQTLGLSTTNWAPNKRKGKPKTSAATQRKMKFRGWVSLLIRDRFSSHVDRRPISSEVVENLLEFGRTGKVPDGEREDTTKVTYPDSCATSHVRLQRNLQKNTSDTKIPPHQLIR